MWLIDVTTRKLKSVNHTDDRHKPKYAILSHTWGQDRDEVQFLEMRSGTAIHKKGYAKIEYTCRQAIADKLPYAWVDTCCIDKSSSAELSEAINSMYKWYREAHVCYAYLEDVPQYEFAKSRWFTRGWTLQELIAPATLVFYDTDWQRIGTRSDPDKLDLIFDATGISKDVLQDRYSVYSKSVACRMSWAAKRETSRVEDRAYSLLGIFDVSLSMIYGEGEKAFRRLQEEIIRSSSDHSLFAWRDKSIKFAKSLLAWSPSQFARCGDIVSWSVPGVDDSFTLSNRGLRICLRVFGKVGKDEDELIAALNCRDLKDGAGSQLGLQLVKQRRDLAIPVPPHATTVCEMRRARKSRVEIFEVDQDFFKKARWLDLLILRDPYADDSLRRVARTMRRLMTLVNETGLSDLVYSPHLDHKTHPSKWDPMTSTMSIFQDQTDSITVKEGTGQPICQIEFQTFTTYDMRAELNLKIFGASGMDVAREQMGETRVQYGQGKDLAIECIKKPSPGDPHWDIYLRVKVAQHVTPFPETAIGFDLEMM